VSRRRSAPPIAEGLVVQPPILPFWFKQRQCRAEPVGTDSMLRVSGPNLGEAFLHITPEEDQRWRAGLRLTADGADVAATEPELASPEEAWEAAFELYRTHVIV
jgi:hypothetical protein